MVAAAFGGAGHQHQRYLHRTTKDLTWNAQSPRTRVRVPVPMNPAPARACVVTVFGITLPSVNCPDVVFREPLNAPMIAPSKISPVLFLNDEYRQQLYSKGTL
jgi:hypothetical protein